MVEEAKAREEEKKKRIKEIAARHQSEYIDNKYQDFEELLGMSEIEDKALKKDDDHHEKVGVLDPAVLNALKETAFFNK